MESNQSMSLPVIDFSAQPLKPNTPAWDSVRAEVLKALEEFGCFEASFPKFPETLRLELFKSTQEFFDLPCHQKNLIASTKLAGYTNGRESVTIEDSNIPQNVESFSRVVWPQGNPSFWYYFNLFILSFKRKFGVSSPFIYIYNLHV